MQTYDKFKNTNNISDCYGETIEIAAKTFSTHGLINILDIMINENTYDNIGYEIKNKIISNLGLLIEIFDNQHNNDKQITD